MGIIESAYSQAVLYVPRKLKLKRSSGWSKIKAEHLKKQPTCQACGSKTRLAVHHIIPIHIDRSKELDPTNLLTLCENPSTGYCHYIFGHCALSWFKWDPDVIDNIPHHLNPVTFAKTNEDENGMILLDLDG